MADELKNPTRLYFVYNLGGAGVALAAPVGTASTQTIAVDNDSPFRIIKITGIAVATAGFADVSRQVTVQISDTDQNATWFRNPMPCFHVMGTAGLPNILPEPRLLGKRCNITIVLQNNSAAAAIVWLEFHGYKLR